MPDTTGSFDSFERKWLAANPENAIVAVFLPHAQRRLASAFGCLIHELSIAAFHIRETQVATTKLEWWKQELADAAFGKPSHPVTHALFNFEGARESDPAMWPALADGALAQLDAPGAGTLSALMEQLDPFFGAVACVENALFCSDNGNLEADAALWTLSHLLRALPQLADGEAHLPLPLGLLARHELTRAQLAYESPQRNMLIKDFLDELVLEGNGALGVSAVRSLPLRVRAAIDRQRIVSALRVTDPLRWLVAHPHAGRLRTLRTTWSEARAANRANAGLR